MPRDPDLSPAQIEEAILRALENAGIVLFNGQWIKDEFLLSATDGIHGKVYLLADFRRWLLALGDKQFLEIDKSGDSVSVKLSHRGFLRLRELDELAESAERERVVQILARPRVEDERLTPVLLSELISPERIEQLRGLQSSKYDFSKLIRLCEELNMTYKDQCHYATLMLIRAYWTMFLRSSTSGISRRLRTTTKAENRLRMR